MRLIDADALRAEYQAILDRGDMFCEYDIIGMVDNAPTVEGEIEILTKEAYSDLCLRASRERPHGEWFITDSYPHRVYCNKCFKTYAQENWEVWKEGSLPRNFCPNCGADMGGGRE